MVYLVRPGEELGLGRHVGKRPVQWAQQAFVRNATSLTGCPPTPPLAFDSGDFGGLGAVTPTSPSHPLLWATLRMETKASWLEMDQLGSV